MDAPSPKVDRRPGPHRAWLLLPLALLMSVACIFFSTWLTLRVRPDRLTSASVLAMSEADYGGLPGESIQFAPLNPNVGAEAAADAAQLQTTPTLEIRPSDAAGQAAMAVTIVALPPTPTPLATPTVSESILGCAAGLGAECLPEATATRPAANKLTPPPSGSPWPTGPAATGSPPATGTRMPTATPPNTPTPLPTATPVPPSPTFTPAPPPPTFTPAPAPPPDQGGGQNCDQGGNQGQGQGCGQGGEKGGGQGGKDKGGKDKGGGKGKKGK